MRVDELRTQLASLNLDTRGHKQALQRRLRKAAKLVAGEISAGSDEEEQRDTEEAEARPPGQIYDAFLVLDVEATCSGGVSGQLAFRYPNEIIEWVRNLV